MLFKGVVVFGGRNVSAMLDRCRYEVATIVIAKYEATGRTMTKEEVERLDKKLMDSCARYYKVVI